MDARATADPTANPAPTKDEVAGDLLIIEGLYQKEDARLAILSDVVTRAAAGLVIHKEKASEFDVAAWTPLSEFEPEAAEALRNVVKVGSRQIVSMMRRSSLLPYYTEHTDL